MVARDFRRSPIFHANQPGAGTMSRSHRGGLRRVVDAAPAHGPLDQPEQLGGGPRAGPGGAGGGGGGGARAPPAAPPPPPPRPLEAPPRVAAPAAVRPGADAAYAAGRYPRAQSP